MPGLAVHRSTRPLRPLRLLRGLRGYPLAALLAMLSACGALSACGGLAGTDEPIRSYACPLSVCPPGTVLDAGTTGDVARADGSSAHAEAGADREDASEPQDRTVPNAEAATNASLRRHVIIAIGDGMHLAHEVATSRYLTGRDDGLSFHAFPVVTFKTTWDVGVYNSYATSLGLPLYSRFGFDPRVGYDPALGGSMPYPLLPDTEERLAYIANGPAAYSASTATAMSTGVKTDSDNLAWLPGDPEYGALETSAETLRRIYGMAIGYATTDIFIEATPGGWFSHSRSRYSYDEIASDILDHVRPDVVIGTGVAYADLEIASRDYLVVGQQPGVDGSTALLAGAVMANQQQKKLLGLFGNGILPPGMPVDRPGNPIVSRASPEIPTLAAASVAALEVLSRDPDGFFLLVEEGNIDDANHSWDFRSMIGSVQDLDEAVAAIVAFVERPGDGVDWTNTTILVTADHANSGLRLDRPLDLGDLPAQEGSSYPEGDVSYHKAGHSNELTTVHARGMAADKLTSYATVYPGLNIIDDTSIYRLTLQAAKR